VARLGGARAGLSACISACVEGRVTAVEANRQARMLEPQHHDGLAEMGPLEGRPALSADGARREGSADADSDKRKGARAARPRAGIKGFGYVYRRGRLWWVRYFHRGRDFRESTHSEREVDALRLLKHRWQQIGRGRFVGPSEDRVTMSQLLDAIQIDYQNNGRRSLKTLLDSRLKPLKAAFGLDRAVDLTEERIERYKRDRLVTKS